MTGHESIDAARDNALDSLVGRHGIIGVGRSEESIVFFVRNLNTARDPIRRWSAVHDVPVELKVIAKFRPAAS